jgi:hypothetical protein
VAVLHLLLLIPPYPQARDAKMAVDPSGFTFGDKKKQRAATEHAVFGQLFGASLNLKARAAELRAAAPVSEQHLARPNTIPIKFQNQAVKEAYKNATEAQLAAVKQAIEDKAAERRREEEERANLTPAQQLQYVCPLPASSNLA